MSPNAGFTLEPDRNELSRFINALFMHANEGGIVSVRAFYDDLLAKRRKEPAFKVRTIRLNGGGLEPVIDLAFRVAAEALEPTRPVVVCPPIATFGSGKADEKSLLEGLVLSLELDEQPKKALAVLRPIIGPPTLVVESGGEWADPESGEVHAKLHIHWRLAEPTQTPEEHARLKRARTLACELVGADATSKPAVHPMRWPGTWHRKNPEAPKLTRIVEENAEAEIILEDALAELEGLAVLRGINDDGERRSNENPTADGDRLMACAVRLPNPLPPQHPGGPERGGWADWNRIGMAFWRASSGSEAGFQAFDTFSRKNKAKYDLEATRARWRHFATSPPSSIGIGALVYEVRRVEPDFLKRKPKVEPPPEEETAGEGIEQNAVDDDWETKLATAIEEMNARYFVAALGGRGVIASLAYDDAMQRERLVFSREQDIRLLYAHRHYIVGHTSKGNAIWKGLGAAWLEDWRRRSFDRIALIPRGHVPDGVFNLWRGFGVEPKAGDWPALRQHIMEIICDRDQAAFDYLIGWCARCVQHPERQAEVAVVLRGEKGTGKGTFAQVLLSIFRDHALHITHSRHLVGNFNNHLTDALLLFLDEAFWAGDKQGEGTLKALVTEPSIMIEPKGIDSFMMPNRLKIVMASNADWVVPATADERRYFVLDVSNARRGDYAYFEKLHAALDGGELAAFLHHLMGIDLASFNVRAVPNTKGLGKQKLVGADSVIRFWEDCLREGAFIGIGGTDIWPEHITTQVLHALYLDHASSHGERHPVIDARMAEKLEELCSTCTFKRVRLPPKDKEPRPWARRLDTLDNHRRAFELALGLQQGTIVWSHNG